MERGLSLSLPVSLSLSLQLILFHIYRDVVRESNKIKGSLIKTSVFAFNFSPISNRISISHFPKFELTSPLCIYPLSFLLFFSYHSISRKVLFLHAKHHKTRNPFRFEALSLSLSNKSPNLMLENLSYIQLSLSLSLSLPLSLRQ